MARTTLTTGACPTCGRLVARTLTTQHGISKETYHCAEHGARDYSGGMTVAEWAAPTMADLRPMLDTVSPAVGGLDWVL